MYDTLIDLAKKYADLVSEYRVYEEKRKQHEAMGVSCLVDKMNMAQVDTERAKVAREFMDTINKLKEREKTNEHE